VPFPHAPDALPSELKKSIFASDLSWLFIIMSWSQPMNFLSNF
jgi:hypothetical protein